MANKKGGSSSKKKSSSSSSKKSSQASASRAVQKEAVRYAKRHKKGVAIAFVTVILILVAAILLIYLFKPEWLDAALREYLDYTGLYYNDSSDDDPEGTVAASSDPVETGTLTGITDGVFSIHFLELGNKYTGDSTLIKCGDTEVLIDAGSRTNSAKPITEYVSQYCTDGKLEYVIATHAHQDHIAGFVGTGSGNNKSGVLYEYSRSGKSIGTIIEFSGHNTTSGVYNNYVTARNFAKANGTNVYTALQCWNQTDGASRSYDLSAAGDGSLTLNILYNYYYDHDTKDENDYSVCMMLTYLAGGSVSHYLFTGDLEGDGESRLVDYYGDDLPQVELFKGGHHGSKTSSTDKLLNKIKPKNVAVCCCAGATEYTTANENTFPTQAFVDRISKWTSNVYCTTLCIDYKAGKFESMNGNIVFYMKDNKLTLWCSNDTKPLKEWEWFKSNRTCPAAWAA